ncbi:MAG: hypothetical protein LBR80_06885 [Deltaproteobacteria bacterium]|nr:hypothetical protein [Deltaproteobacteria bacterium]
MAIFVLPLACPAAARPVSALPSSPCPMAVGAESGGPEATRSPTAVSPPSVPSATGSHFADRGGCPAGCPEVLL